MSYFKLPSTATCDYTSKTFEMLLSGAIACYLHLEKRYCHQSLSGLSDPDFTDVICWITVSSYWWWLTPYFQYGACIMVTTHTLQLITRFFIYWSTFHDRSAPICCLAITKQESNDWTLAISVFQLSQVRSSQTANYSIRNKESWNKKLEIKVGVTVQWCVMQNKKYLEHLYSWLIMDSRWNIIGYWVNSGFQSKSMDFITPSYSFVHT